MDTAYTVVVYLIYAFICIGIPVIIIGGIVYLISRKPRSNSVSTNSVAEIGIDDNEFIKRLKEYKKSGLRTIDEVISYIQKESESIVEQEVVAETVTPVEIQEEERPQVISHAPKEATSLNANLILYLGSFLVTFAMLAIVSLTWNTISDILKVSLLVINLLGFLVVGFILSKSQKLRRAGVTFLTVGSVGYFLLIAGVWNFVVSKYIPDNFNQYWLLTSISALALNIVIMRVLNEKRFFYLLIISIYSIIFSFAFSLTDDSNFRVIAVLLMNLGLYLSSSFFKSYNSSILTVSKIINFIGNFFVSFAVLNLLSSIKTPTHMILATLSLLIPTVFMFVSYFREKSSAFLVVELFVLVFKALIISQIWSFNSDYALVFFACLALAYMILAFYVFSKNSKALYFISAIISYLIVFFISIIVFSFNFMKYLPQISQITTYAVLIISQVTIILIPLVKKYYRGIGFALVYMLLFFAITVNLIFPNTTSNVYAYVLLGFGVISGIVELLAYKKNINPVKFCIQPISAVALVFSFLLSITAFSNETFLWNVASIVIGVLTVYLVVRAFVMQSQVARYLANITFVLFCFSLVNYLVDRHLFEAAVNYSYLFLIPVAALWVLIEFVLKDRAIPEKLSFLALYSVGMIYTQPDIYTVYPATFNSLPFLIFISALLLVSIYRMFRFGTIRYSVTSSILLNLTVALLLSYCKVANEYVIVSMTGVNSLLALLEVTKMIEFRGLKALNVTSLVINIFLMIFTLIGSAFMPKGLPIFSLIHILVFASMIMSTNKLSQKLSGVPVLFAVWNLFSIYNFHTQFSVAALTIYLLVLAFVNYREGNKTAGKGLEIVAYLIQAMALFINSFAISDDTEQVVVGLILIFLCTALFLYGVKYNRKFAWIIAVVFLVLELFIRLISVIVLIPWWAYLIVIGLVLIFIAINQIKKQN